VCSAMGRSLIGAPWEIHILSTGCAELVYPGGRSGGKGGGVCVCARGGVLGRPGRASGAGEKGTTVVAGRVWARSTEEEPARDFDY